MEKQKKLTRGEELGKNLAYVVIGLSERLTVPNHREFLERVGEEVEKYSLMPRREGTPPNKGTRHSRNMKEIIEISDPVCVAGFVKYCFDMTYNKDRAAKMKRGFLSTIKTLQEE